MPTEGLTTKAVHHPEPIMLDRLPSEPVACSVCAADLDYTGHGKGRPIGAIEDGQVLCDRCNYAIESAPEKRSPAPVRRMA